MEMNNKKKVKFLTVIWGDRYIEEFARVSLPSYLAPNNLPHMAAHTDLGVLIMTSKDSVATLKENPVFKKLEALCPVEFILIDDLITNGVYGVVLTLAYARGIRSCGDEQVDTHFVFMNSDFVIADGSLKTLTEEIEADKSVVMVSSLRASAEAVMPELLKSVDPQKMELTMAPRDMVKLALGDLHPTVIGKTINQDFVSSSTYNQIYWAIDQKTLLGRCHLIFMLMIKPERPLPPINSYCDYGLVPELAPSATLTAIEDSDRFFMLEAQPAKQELEFLRCGVKSPAEIASQLSVWTTSEHRACADFNFIFHSDDLPDSVSIVKERAGKFMRELGERMARSAKDHAYHYYWVSGVESWAFLRRQGDVYNKAAVEAETEPPEFRASPAYETYLSAKSQELQEDAKGGDGLGARRWSGASLKSMVRRMGAALVNVFSRRFVYVVLARVGTAWLRLGRYLKGEYPDVASWSSGWSDAKLVRDWISKATIDKEKKTLLVGDKDSPLLRLFERSNNVVCTNETDFLTLRELGADGYSNILIQVNRADIRRMQLKIEQALRLTNSQAEIAISISHPNYEIDASNFSYELAQYVDEILPEGWLGFEINALFTGGKIKRRLRLLEGGVAAKTLPRSVWQVPVAFVSVLSLPIIAGLTALNNLSLRRASRVCPDFCSSALLVLRSRRDLNN